MMLGGKKESVSDKKTTITYDFIRGHEYEFIVRAVGPDGTNQALEDAARNTIVIAGKDAAPDTPITLTATGFLETVVLNWTAPVNYDFAHMEIWRSATNSVGTALKVAQTSGITYTDDIGIANVTRYYWIRAVNTSGEVSGYYPDTTAGVAATTTGVTVTSIDDFSITATKMFNKTIILSGDAWTNNSPGAGSIAWNEHDIVYNGVKYHIFAGNSALAYIYWVTGSTNYSGSATHPTLGTTRFMVAINTSGTHTLVWNSSANMVIGTAFIANLAVTTAKIDNLAVTDAKINTLSVGKLTAGTINSQSIVLGITGGAGDVEIRAGIATGDFANVGAASGFIIGLDDSDSDKPKFYIGDATHNFAWNGTNIVQNNVQINTLAAGSEVGIQGWQMTMDFTAFDNDTVSWTSGDIIFTNAVVYNIDAGNTGNMGDTTYIYFDKAASITVLQTTTTAANAVGAGKVLICVAEGVAAKAGPAYATFQVFGGMGTNMHRPITGGQLEARTILAEDIVANTITANEIFANTITVGQLAADVITAGKIHTDLLTATNIQTGTLTAITVQTASSGQRIVLDQSTNTFTMYKGAGAGSTCIYMDDNIVGSRPGINIVDSVNGSLLLVTKSATDRTAIREGTIQIYAPSSPKVIFTVTESAASVFSVNSNGNVIAAGIMSATSYIITADKYYVGAASGLTTTFLNGDGDTVTVTGGIITGIA